jgi:serine/threonine-protein kinase
MLLQLHAERSRRTAAQADPRALCDTALAEPSGRPLRADRLTWTTLCPVSGEPPAPTPARAASSRRSGHAPGAVLAGRYQLVEPLGEGGMGAVWRARSLCLDVDVAVKLVRHDAGVPNAGERLLREARVAARVRHSAAVRVFDFCLTESGDPLLVMELLPGRSLARALADNGPLAPLHAVRLLLPVIGALAAAHREGIVHRDVKPTNVMLVEEGGRVIPKLIDFGIAGVAPSAWSSKLSSYAALLGSPVYMSPEQARGVPDLEARTDVWGACTVLYEAVSGERPFGGADRASVVQDILSARPRRPAALADHPRLWEILERGLAKSPEQRWPTMAALGAALAAWALEGGATCDTTGAPLADPWRDAPAPR